MITILWVRLKAAGLRPNDGEDGSYDVAPTTPMRGLLQTALGRVQAADLSSPPVRAQHRG